MLKVLLTSSAFCATSPDTRMKFDTAVATACMPRLSPKVSAEFKSTVLILSESVATPFAFKYALYPAKEAGASTDVVWRYAFNCSLFWTTAPPNVSISAVPDTNFLFQPLIAVSASLKCFCCVLNAVMSIPIILPCKSILWVSLLYSWVIP